MWSSAQSPSRLQRTASINSFISDHSSNASSEDLQSFLPRGQSMWAAAPHEPSFQQMNSNVARLSQKFGNSPAVQTTALPSPPLSHEHSRVREQLSLDLTEDDYDSARSRSSTLGGEEEETEDPFEYDYPQKTPTPQSLSTKLVDLVDFTAVEETKEYLRDIEEASQNEEPPAPVHEPGPLEIQLQALMSKIVFIEQENPLVSVTPEEHNAPQSRVQELEAEKKSWQVRHEALFALRDEDISNIIKTRGLLAKVRRDLEGMTKLRDDDLVNLQLVRGKLAEATRKLEKMEKTEAMKGPESGRGTPTGSRGRPSSILLERRDTTDLFAAAKAAALEQRTLELEKRNEDLLARIEEMKRSALASAPAPAPSLQAQRTPTILAFADGHGSLDEINRLAAHKAWKETVADLNAKLKAKDDEIVKLRASSATLSAPTSVSTPAGTVLPDKTPVPTPAAPLALTPGSYDWHRVEALHEEHASYRERTGGRMQRLRAEKEELQKELHRKEDECHALEVRVQSLQRRVGVV